MRNLIIVLVTVLIFVSCGGENAALPEPETADEVVEVEVAEDPYTLIEFDESLNVYSEILHYGDRMYVDATFEVDSKSEASVAWIDSVGGNDCWPEVFYTEVSNEKKHVSDNESSTDSWNSPFFDNCNELHYIGFPNIGIDSFDTSYILWSYTLKDDLDTYGLVFLKITEDGFKAMDGKNISHENLDDAFLEIGNEGIDITSFVLDSNDNPHILWNTSVYKSPDKIYYIRWDGSAWRTIDGELFNSDNNGKVAEITNDYIRFMKIETDSQNIPYIIWENYNDSTKQKNLNFLKWDGTSWTYFNSLPEIITAECDFYYGVGDPNIFIDLKNNIHITWNDEENEQIRTNYIKWNGSDWLTINGDKFNTESNNAGLPVNGVTFVDDNGNLHVVIDHYLVYMIWDGKNWTDYAGKTINPETYTESFYFSDGRPPSNVEMRVDDYGNPHFIWLQWGGLGPDIYYMTWEEKSKE